jgi:CheY-like chemotaxis protein
MGASGDADPTVRTVMVVDDCEDIRHMLRLMLQMQGYRVLEATDGRQAVEAACGARPDLILMDLDMPVLDGIAATRQIRAIMDVCRVPIVAVSAHDPERSRPKLWPRAVTTSSGSRSASAGSTSCSPV